MVEFFKNLFKSANVKQNVPVIKVKSVVDNSPPQLKSLFVSAGHSEVDAGASREYDGRLFTEADIVLEFRDMVCERLEKCGITFTRDGKAVAYRRFGARTISSLISVDIIWTLTIL